MNLTQVYSYKCVVRKDHSLEGEIKISEMRRTSTLWRLLVS